MAKASLQARGRHAKSEIEAATYIGYRVEKAEASLKERSMASSFRRKFEVKMWSPVSFECLGSMGLLRLKLRASISLPRRF